MDSEKKMIKRRPFIFDQKVTDVVDSYVEEDKMLSALFIPKKKKKERVVG